MQSLKNEIVALDPYARVNVVQPGWTVTEMTRRNLDDPGVVERVVRTMPLRQLGRAEDVARAVAFLRRRARRGTLSGQVLTVAGGMEGRVRWEAERGRRGRGRGAAGARPRGLSRGAAMELEASYDCPSCGEEIVIPVDPSNGARQDLVEDCPVCCNPNRVHVELERDDQARAWAEAE